MGPFRSLFVLMDFNGSLLVFITPHASLWIPNVSLCVFKCSYEFKWVFMGPSMSLCVFMGPYGSLLVLTRFYVSLWIPVAFLCVFVGFY